MSGILVWLGRLYTGFTLSSDGYYADRCVISVKFHWPVFTLLVSISQWVCFQLGKVYANNGWISESDFEANHLKRHQIWRQLTYLFVHEDDEQLWYTLYHQILIGCCLEIVNGWKSVLLVYFGGAFVSDMVDFFAGSEIERCGAADAVTGLYAAYIATVILNWKETSGAKVRVYYLLFCMFSTLTAPFWYSALVDIETSHASNIGGALGGFVVGFCFVKIFRKRLWKIKMKKKFFKVAMILLGFVIFSFCCNPVFYALVQHRSHLAKLLGLRDVLLQRLQNLEEQKRHLLSLTSSI